MIGLLVVTVGCGLVIYANYKGCDPVTLKRVVSADQVSHTMLILLHVAFYVTPFYWTICTFLIPPVLFGKYYALLKSNSKVVLANFDFFFHPHQQDSSLEFFYWHWHWLLLENQFFAIIYTCMLNVFLPKVRKKFMLLISSEIYGPITQTLCEVRSLMLEKTIQWKHSKFKCTVSLFPEWTSEGDESILALH